MLQLKRIIETALYVKDLTAAKNFYYKTLHLEVMVESDVLVAFNVGGLNTLLLFRRGASLQTKYLSGGEIPRTMPVARSTCASPSTPMTCPAGSKH